MVGKEKLNKCSVVKESKGGEVFAAKKKFIMNQGAKKRKSEMRWGFRTESRL